MQHEPATDQFDTPNASSEPLPAEGAAKGAWLLPFFSWPMVAVAVSASFFFFILGLGAGIAVAANQSTSALATTGWLGSLTGGTAASPVCAETAERFYPEFQTFWEAMGLLYRDFYGELPDAQGATYQAIRGFLSTLDDPNTSFLTPQEADHFRTNLAGSFEGIGARVQWDEEMDTLRITEPFENQPAWRAGLRRGDYILAVDGVSIIGTDQTEAIDRIRGPKGSTVVLTVLHAIDEEPVEISIVRDRIETPTIVTKTLGAKENLAYVKLNTFNQNAGQLVRQAVEDAVTRKVDGLIFDLRGNSGGLLREAVKVANIFLQDQTVLIERFSNGTQEIYQTEEAAVAPTLPMIVLVNEGSASASEIVAGALQDHGRAPLLGSVTYGKGSVQLPHTLKDGSIMRVTVARWYTPNDRTIDGEGLQPDVPVEMTKEDVDQGADPQLDAAIAQLEAETGQ